jgi:hypothetical protein
MNRTDFLFANPTFIGGLASVLDLGSTMVVYNESPSIKVADVRAMESDWRVTGEDLKASMALWVEENSIHE